MLQPQASEWRPRVAADSVGPQHHHGGGSHMSPGSAQPPRNSLLVCRRTAVPPAGTVKLLRTADRHQHNPPANLQASGKFSYRVLGCGHPTMPGPGRTTRHRPPLHLRVTPGCSTGPRPRAAGSGHSSPSSPRDAAKIVDGASGVPSSAGRCYKYGAPPQAAAAAPEGLCLSRRA
ncbi:hypothetical protein NDU88_004239 [Pleurodeles waltl]|uniref:Uncharacterized protein n=1 Tax=Pleurodeles waltl TaxID=8319 RepID=A0AAV7T7F6_PLEWA|nr:hypothetical protein NDU88_004239 [Pleurodeles waltl]